MTEIELLEQISFRLLIIIFFVGFIAGSMVGTMIGKAFVSR